jgi:undecaprenyl-diphosphatase
MSKKGKLIGSALCCLLTIILIVLVQTVDVRRHALLGSKIGLFHLNREFFLFTGVNLVWYDITEVLGYVAILVAAIFALVGVVQLFRRKSLLKVDREIISLGVLYAVVVGLYVFFEIFIVNYRPIIIPGDDGLEASFPSSHTMLICVVMGSTMMVVGKYIQNKALCKAVQIVCGIILVATVFGRLISGVHWLTDIIGGILISAALLLAYSGITENFE